jgi:DNA polymerase IV
MADRTIIHVDLDAFFVAVEQVLNPELIGKPVVVGGSAGHRGVVATASYEARKYGLRSAMPMATAIRLCPQAIIIPGHYTEYRSYSRRFMAILADFSPFLQPMGLDEAYLDATGFESLHGSIFEMARKIKARVRSELGIVASIGIAPCKVVAKVASDESKPDGLIEVKKGEEVSFLAPLNIRKLPGVGKKTEEALRTVGIQTIGDLVRRDRGSIVSRFGTLGEMLCDYARGIDDREVHPPGEPKSVSRETTFQEDSRDRDFLLAVLRRQAEKVGADLRESGKQARCIGIKIRYSDFETLTRHRTLSDATDTNEMIFRVGTDLLTKLLSSERRAVRLLGIEVSSLTEPGIQLSMLDQREKRLRELDRAVDSIRLKHGFDVIATGRTASLKGPSKSSPQASLQRAELPF